MEAPKYMNSLELVAEKFGGLTDHRNLGTALAEAWTTFEANAKVYSYDILSTNVYNVREHMTRLLELLYRVPNCTWFDDVRQLRSKDAEYGGSWHRRGGPGAFMMLARKWDRIENAIKMHSNLGSALDADRREEGILDDLADLRCYLLLVMSWHFEILDPQPEPTQSDLVF